MTTKGEALKKVMKFVNFDSELSFDEKLILLRVLRDVKDEISREQDNLNIILLRLRYGVKQGVPLGWGEVVCVPSEIAMNKKVVEEPVSGGEKIRALNKVREKKYQSKKPSGVKLKLL